MNIKAYTIIVLLFFNYLGFSQNTILCPIQETTITIEDPANIPSITNNPDGTITLTHTESYITDIFANYVIHDFRLTYPTGTGGFLKYYTIAFETKDLINDLNTNVPSSIITTYSYQSTPISTGIIDFLDGKLFRLKKHCQVYDIDGLACADSEETVPNDFTLVIEFNYDAPNDLLFANSYTTTPCGNTFSFAQKGGNNTNKLQLWNSFPGISTETTNADYCHTIEYTLYNILDIGCEGGGYADDLYINIDIINNSLSLERQGGFSQIDVITFEEYTLSTQENTLDKIKLFESGDHLLISNAENKNISLTVFSVSGQQVLTKTPYQDYQIKIDNLNSGLYFIKITSLNNQSKVFKFLKR